MVYAPALSRDGKQVLMFFLLAAGSVGPCGRFLS